MKLASLWFSAVFLLFFFLFQLAIMYIETLYDFCMVIKVVYGCLGVMTFMFDPLTLKGQGQGHGVKFKVTGTNC